MVDHEPQVHVQLHGRGVAGVHIQHPDGEAALVQVVEAGDHQLAAQSRSPVPPVRVDGDDVDLAEWRVGVLVDLRPAEPVEPALAVLVQQEAGRVEPGLGFPLLQGGPVPASLLGVPVKGPVVDLQPGVLVDADPERPGDDGARSAGCPRTGSGRRIW